MRLAQFIALSGGCSRRAASRLIEQGEVYVDGEQAGHLSFVQGDEQVLVAGERLQLPSSYQYVLYNKPVGIDCNCHLDKPESIINQIPMATRLFPVGRIDKDSHGLMLLTNDGGLCHKLLSPEFSHPKQYRVEVRPHHHQSDIGDKFVQLMEQGIELKKGQINKGQPGLGSLKTELTLPCKLELLGVNTFQITLTQGLHRQIRRMCQTLGYSVVDLQRTAIVNLQLGSLAVNQYRELTETELIKLKALVI